MGRRALPVCEAAHVLRVYLEELREVNGEAN